MSVLVVTNPTDSVVNHELSLRQAVVQANADAAAGTSDTITFDPSLGGHTINISQGQLELSGAGTGTITINGSSPSIPVTLDVSSAGSGRAFQIDSGVQAVITNINIEDGNVRNGNAASQEGGAILNAGTLTLSNADISDSSASNGGAIENTGTLTLSNTTLTGNDATTSGGAIDNSGTLVVSDCTLTSNQAASGGAISNSGTLSVSNTTFSENSASNSGGSINNASSGTLTVSGGFFTGNNADNAGAIENNSANPTTLSNIIFSGNEASYDGGAIENDAGSLTLANSTVSSNTAQNGGAIYIGTDSSVNVNSSTLSSNTASTAGGAIENKGTVSLTDASVFSNTADGSGAGIDNEGALSLSNATVTANTADESGGGINNNGGTLVLSNTIVSADTAHGGGTDINGAITTDDGYNLLGTAVNNTTNDPTPGKGDVFSDKPGLSAAGNYGGPTQTLALLTGSPAIGAGNAGATNPSTDQRGLPRMVNGSVNIGAFQTQPPAIVFNSLGETTDAGQSTGPITVALQDPDGNPVSAGTVSYSGNDTTADTTGDNNLTMVGGAGFAAGQTGQAISLSGASQYAITPNLESLFQGGDSSVTVSLWFNASGPGVILDELGQTSINTGWHDSQIEILANGTVKVRVWDLSAVTLGTASFNVWHNVVLRYNEATQTLDGFLDGVQSTSSVSGNRSTSYGSGYGLYYAFGATRRIQPRLGCLLQRADPGRRHLQQRSEQHRGPDAVQQRRRGHRHAEQQLLRRQLLVPRRLSHQRRPGRRSAGSEHRHGRIHRHPAGNTDNNRLRDGIRLRDAAGNDSAGPDRCYSGAGDRRGARALVLRRP